MCGGYEERNVGLKSVERFDSRVGKWEYVAPMRLSPRVYADAALLNGKIYVAGGWNNYATRLETVEM